MKMRTFAIIVFAVAAMCGAQAQTYSNTIAATYNFALANSTLDRSMRLTITPIAPPPKSQWPGAFLPHTPLPNVFLVPSPITFSVAQYPQMTNGNIVVSNLWTAYPYLVVIQDYTGTNGYTNWFPTNLSGVVDAATNLAVLNGTNIYNITMLATNGVSQILAGSGITVTGGGVGQVTITAASSVSNALTAAGITQPTPASHGSLGFAFLSAGQFFNPYSAQPSFDATTGALQLPGSVSVPSVLQAASIQVTNDITIYGKSALISGSASPNDASVQTNIQMAGIVGIGTAAGSNASVFQPASSGLTNLAANNGSGLTNLNAAANGLVDGAGVTSIVTQITVPVSTITSNGMLTNTTLYAATNGASGLPLIDASVLTNIAYYAISTTPSIVSFVNNLNSLEIGQTATSTVLTWVLAGTTPTNQTLDQGIGSVAVGTLTYTDTAHYTSSRTYNLTTTDGHTSPTAATSITFYSKEYWGASSQTASTISDAQIIALGNSAFATTRVISPTPIITTASNYIFICYPASFGAATFTVNGFLDGGWTLVTRSFVNSSGGAVSYNIYQHTLPTVGNFSVLIQ